MDIVKIGNSEIIAKEYRGSRVVTFKDIDIVHEKPEGTAKRNFNTNKKHFIEGEDFFLVSRNELGTDFVQTYGFGESAPSGTLITESGYLMIVKSLTGDLAWDVQRQLVKSYFNKKKLNPMTIQEQIQLLAQGNVELEKKIDAVSKDLQDFKEDMPLLAVECEKITKAKNRKVVPLMGGKESNAYKDNSLRGKVYSDLDLQLKREFGVSSYKAIKRNQCDLAVSIIEKYELPMSLAENIKNANAQINIEY